MNLTEDFVPKLKKLRLSGILHTLDLRAKQAVEDNSSYIEFLYRLLSDEVERRQAKQLQLRVRRAQFDHDRHLEDFDFSFNPEIPKAKVIDLATCTFVELKRNACLIGPAGVGKSHIAQAVGQRACRQGHRALFLTANRMFADLRAARADNSYERQMLRLCNPDLLIIDDLGLRPLRHQEPEDLYEVIRRRYERGSIVITSNRDVQEWYPLFGDALMASAAMDRLLENAHVIVMDGDSYRNPPPGRSKKLNNAQSGSP